eukprot:TRINITY_DN10602_c0_g1_i1.p1 TRINITY_DN10602_c0_g1~~TRINITY_DN10602_c0_g1_i1.p1  ORF type:complete len:217 (-),score=43.01 TRINITY_DN10602_c0_g1_i1:89-739(-)
MNKKGNLCFYYNTEKGCHRDPCPFRHVPNSGGGGGGGSGSGGGSGGARVDSILKYVPSPIHLHTDSDRQWYKSQEEAIILRDFSEMPSWPLTCYGTKGGTDNVPVLVDRSPEEIRCEAYMAVKSGTLPQQLTIEMNFFDAANKFINEQVKVNCEQRLINAWNEKQRSEGGGGVGRGGGRGGRGDRGGRGFTRKTSYRGGGGGYHNRDGRQPDMNDY